MTSRVMGENMLPKTGVTALKKKFFRKGQAGQSIILLAIGFLALLGFVGIVTDVSLLFVRYSTLRRAVDAAAVAAAGQMRRVANEDGSSIDNPGVGLDDDQGQSVSIANLNLAARQFIEVYGLDPNKVIVETCYAQQIARDTVTSRPLDDAGVPLYIYNAAGAKTGINPLADAEVRTRYEQLCKDNELKLVRVTAQIDSPTVFMGILGVPSITITESSISQSAVLDVVLILDVSESMAYETTYDDWGAAGYNYRYAPPKVGDNDWTAWDYLINNSMNTILATTGPGAGVPLYGYGRVNAGVPEAVSAIIDPDIGWQTGPTVEFLPDGFDPATSTHTRAECQVRVAPTTVFRTGASIPAWLRQEYVDEFGESWVQQRYYFAPEDAGSFRGFLPMYRSYACCNDPDGDFDFADLVCQPFQRVREATSAFLNNLDFIRGDRVAFVTFDNQAYIIDPDGVGGQSPMIEAENNLNPNGDVDINGNDIIDPNLNERWGAQEILETVVGVRAEPTYYDMDTATGRWTGLQEYDGASAACDPGNPETCWEGKNWAYFQTQPVGSIYVQPSINSCFLDRAVLLPPQVPGDTQQRQAGNVVWSLLTDAVSAPSWFWDISAATPGNPTWEGIYFGGRRAEQQSAEYRAGCGSGNVGAGLARSQNALINGGRTEGAVWLMVLLSDGASGASDPVARTTGVPVQFPNIYNRPASYWQPLGGEPFYGSYGVCPYGTQAAPGELLNPGDLKFPFCSDKAPETRSYCSTLAVPPTQIELGATTTSCYQYYDADDYAHDWADWIAMANLRVEATSSVQRQGNEQLPTIFTIGIGLDFNPIVNGVRVCGDTDWSCRINQESTWEDYLGEQLLRYIADLGDNNQIDDDYWQCYLGNRIENSVVADRVTYPGAVGIRLDTAQTWVNTACGDKTNVNWGLRGPCEDPTTDPSSRGFWLPLQPQQSCGNYFAAATPSELERVFSVIASRMFTRLSQ